MLGNENVNCSKTALPVAHPWKQANPRGATSLNRSNLYDHDFCLLELKCHENDAVDKYRAFPPISSLITLSHLLSAKPLPEHISEHPINKTPSHTSQVEQNLYFYIHPPHLPMCHSSAEARQAWRSLKPSQIVSPARDVAYFPFLLLSFPNHMSSPT